MSQRDYYEVLDVSKNVNEAELKKAYRQKALKFHPDKNPGDKQAEDHFKEASEAYEVLKDPEKRQIYDQFGHDGLKGRGFNGFSGFDDIFSQFGDIFGDFFGGGNQRERTGADLRLDIRISFKEAAFGTKKEVEVEKYHSCGTCKGSRSKPGHSPQTCRTCRGTGQVVRAQGFFSVQSHCPDCRGAGQTITHPCDECRGEGRIRGNESLSINIPAGVGDGAQLRLQGKGESSPGLPPGDLYVITHVTQHEFFHREENDIHCKMTLTFPQAALGTDIEVSLLEENKTKVISIPPGTQNNGTYRIPGGGIPRLRGGGRGNHIIHFSVETPKSLNKRQKELYKELAEIDGHSFTDTLKGLFQKLKM